MPDYQRNPKTDAKAKNPERDEQRYNDTTLHYTDAVAGALRVVATGVSVEVWDGYCGILKII